MFLALVFLSFFTTGVLGYHSAFESACDASGGTWQVTKSGEGACVYEFQNSD